jgi:NADH dehydrogenase FAD-containing subunit
VGTLEFRCIEEPVRTIKNLSFFQAKARAIDFRKQEVVGEDIFRGGLYLFSYDYLVLAPGSKTNTFNTPGVEVYDAKGAHRAPGVYYLKNLYHARYVYFVCDTFMC